MLIKDNGQKTIKDNGQKTTTTTKTATYILQLSGFSKPVQNLDTYLFLSKKKKRKEEC